MLDFLKDFEKRMEKLSYPFLIDSQVVMKTEWEKYGLKLQQTINLVYSVMCLIMDRSLKEEECTYGDINDFLMELLKEHYNIYLDEAQIYELSQYIVRRVLRNEGVMFVFEAMDYENNAVKPYQYHLVNQGYCKEDAGKSTFKLTDEGYRLILNSFEVDQKLQIEIESFIAEQSIIRNNYKQAIRSVRNLSNLITTQIQAIDNFILRARENVLFINHEEFNSFLCRDIEILNEQNKRFIDLQASVVTEKNKVLLLIESNLDKEHHDKFRQLAEIEDSLGKIIGKATRLIGKHFSIDEEYSRALSNINFLPTDKIDIKEKLLLPMERDFGKLANADSILKCLFPKKIDKKLNLNKIFENQKVVIKEKEDDVVIEEAEATIFEDNEKKIRDENYRSIVETILMFISKNKNAELKDLINEYDGKKYEEYIKLVPSVRRFSEVLIELVKIREIDIQDMVAVYSKRTISIEDLPVLDIYQFLYEVINKNIELKSMRFMRVFNKNTDETVEIREKVPKSQESIIEEYTVAKCDNFILEIE